MADVTKVKASDGTIYDINDVNDYTKDETDALLAGKADVGDSYTKVEDDALLAAKADTGDSYTKAEDDVLLATKAGVGDSYTKAEDDALLATKAGVGDSYTKAEDDALLAVKADASSLDNYTLKATFVQFQGDVNVEFQNRYTKTEDDALLGNKANSSDVYTKAEVDALIGGLKMFPLLDFANPLYTFDETHTSFTAQGDCYLFGSLYGSAKLPEVTVNGTIILHAGAHTATVGSNLLVPVIRLTTGDEVSVTNMSIYSPLHIFNERSV